jgi:hypothetical protein
MLNRLRTALAHIAAAGAVKRRGLGGLQNHPGTVTGTGRIVHKSGPKKGQSTEINIEGGAAVKNR